MARYLKTATEGGILTITLNDPDAAVNTVSPAWVEEMTAAFKAAQADIGVTGIVIASAKPGFMAGADLKFILDNPMDAQSAFAFSQRATRLHRLIETCGKPVVAAITGFALGGGYELALACTYRILADDPKAKVGLPEVTVGLLPGSGGTQRLPRMIGVVKASDVLLNGASYLPKEALALGLVDSVVPKDAVLSAAHAWLATDPDPARPWDKKGFAVVEADGLLKQQTAGWLTMATGKLRARYGDNYPAPIGILTSIFEGIQVPIDKGLLVESRHFALLVSGSVSGNIIRTSFISKQAAEMGARRPQGYAASKVRKLGVIGAGMMGAGIALVSAQAGIEVVLIDRDVASAAKGKTYAVKALGSAVEKGSLTQAAADIVLARIVPTDNYAQLIDADLIIEAVFEDIGIKGETTRKSETVIPAGAIYATNTSTLPITELAKASARPDQFIGLHFFSPVDRMGLVEVIRGQLTSDETLAKSLDFIAQLRKTPIVVNDSRGFYTSRVFQTLIHEGAAMLADGVAPALIENAAKSAGFPVGPLALLDETTIDLPLKIVDQAIEQDGATYIPPIGVPVMKKMQAIGRIGRKSGGAFYEYPEGHKKRLWTGLAEIFPPSDEQPTPEELRLRFLFAQAMETARCLEEGVLETPEDADLGSVYGWGFPMWTGGTISYIDTIGLAEFVTQADRLAKAYGARFAPSAWLRTKAGLDEAFYDNKAKEALCAA